MLWQSPEAKNDLFVQIVQCGLVARYLLRSWKKKFMLKKQVFMKTPETSVKVKKNWESFKSQNKASIVYFLLYINCCVP